MKNEIRILLVGRVGIQELEYGAVHMHICEFIYIYIYVYIYIYTYIYIYMYT